MADTIRLRNEDMTDRELLLTIWEAGGRNGVTTSDIADALGISTNGKNRTPAMRIGSRLAWMHRYGFLERIKDDDTGTSVEIGKGNPNDLWVVTPIGQTLMQGRLPKSVEASLGKMDPGGQLLLMRSLTRRTIVEGGVEEVATAMRREYLHQVAKRPRMSAKR